MAQDKKVEQITSMEDDFAQWYTDICKKAELIDYSSVKGFMILRPYSYAIWENIQRIMDGEFKKTGHENVAMPALIPESLLKRKANWSTALPLRWLGSPWAAATSWRSGWLSAPPLRPCSATTGTVSFRPTASSPCSITSGAP